MVTPADKMLVRDQGWEDITRSCAIAPDMGEIWGDMLRYREILGDIARDCTR